MSHILVNSARVGGTWDMPRPADGWRQAAHGTAAAVAAIGLLTMAALPSNNSASGATSVTPADVTSAPGRETAVGAYLGAPYHYPSDFKLTKEGRHDLTIKDVNWFTLPFDNPLYYGWRIQRWMAGGTFGTMIDFTHSKAFAPLKTDTKLEGTLNGAPAPETAQLKDYFSKLEFTHGHNMLTLNGMMRFASFGPIIPYAGAGAGISLPHSELHVRTDPSRTYEYQYTGPNAQALFGIEYRLKTGSVFIEYKFTTADYLAPLTGRDGSWLPIDMWRQFSRWWSGQEPPSGWASTTLTSHQVISGFTVRFASKTTAGIAAP